MGQNLLQHLGTDAQDTTGNLHDGAVGLAPEAYHQRRPNDSFMADHGNFHTSAIAGDHYHRGQATIQEIRVTDFFAGLVQNLPVIQLNGLEVRAQASEFLGCDGQQRHILHRISDDVRANPDPRDRFVPSVSETNVLFHVPHCGTTVIRRIYAVRVEYVGWKEMSVRQRTDKTVDS